MALRVVGAGFGRTGTLSLKIALEQLGFAKCHHMREVFGSRRQVEAWHALSRGQEVDWERVFEGFQAAVDWPSSAYWEQLHRFYPDSRVILSTRDPERWYRSVRQTIYRVSGLIPKWLIRVSSRVRLLKEMIDRTIWEGVFDGRLEDPEHALRVYREHAEHVRRVVAPERLLVFEAKDGWEPLCAFLGVPVPDTPYPHVNDTRSFQRALVALRILRWLPLGLLAALAVALLW